MEMVAQTATDVNRCQMRRKDGEHCRARPCARIDDKLVCYAHTPGACREANARQMERWRALQLGIEEHGSIVGVVGL